MHIVIIAFAPQYIGCAKFTIASPTGDYYRQKYYTRKMIVVVVRDVLPKSLRVWRTPRRRRRVLLVSVALRSWSRKSYSLVFCVVAVYTGFLRYYVHEVNDKFVRVPFCFVLFSVIIIKDPGLGEEKYLITYM